MRFRHLFKLTLHLCNSNRYFLTSAHLYSRVIGTWTRLQDFISWYFLHFLFNNIMLCRWTRGWRRWNREKIKNKFCIFLFYLCEMWKWRLLTYFTCSLVVLNSQTQLSSYGTYRMWHGMGMTIHFFPNKWKSFILEKSKAEWKEKRLIFLSFSLLYFSEACCSFCKYFRIYIS